MNKDNELDMQALWQSIEPQTGPDSADIIQQAKRDKRKTKMALWTDITSVSFLLFVLIRTANNDVSWLITSFLILAFFYSVWLTWDFHKSRTAGFSHLSDSTSNYQLFAQQNAQGAINLGRRLIQSNVLIGVSFAAVMLIEKFYIVDGLDVKWYGWLWMAFWFVVLHYYGTWRMNKGKQRLTNLKKMAES